MAASLFMEDVMPRSLPLALCCLLSLAPARAAAQADRFEIGQRLRAFESAWDRQQDPAARRRALDAVQGVVMRLFENRSAEAARLLTGAQNALYSADEPPAYVRWAQSLALRLGRRLADIDAAELPVSLDHFYPAKAEAAKGAALKLTLLTSDGKTVVASREVPITALPLETALPLKGARLDEGDHLLRAEIVAGGQVLDAIPEQTISLAAGLASRLTALRKGIAALPVQAASTDVLTLYELAGLLTRLADGRTLETNYPAARLLGQAEAALKAVQGGRRYFGDEPGEFWLRLATGKGGSAVRLLAPDAVKQGRPVPLVIALHGAGGSENLFFDGYGNGAIVRLCRERGWLLVAPRTDGLVFDFPAAALVDEVSRLFSVDRMRVFVVGHSMGAMQAVRAAQEAPGLIAGVAALGGGMAVKASEALKAVPFFVGVGTRDFLAMTARALKDSLVRAGVHEVEYRAYPEVEHMMVVPIALPEVFAFFDKAAKR
jgi:pimeloyl-ACP methyl ester carboxylesterase